MKSYIYTSKITLNFFNFFKNFKDINITYKHSLLFFKRGINYSVYILRVFFNLF